MATKLLLLQDVESVGRKGEVVSVRDGYARNRLIPFGFAMGATEQALRHQKKLSDERAKQALIDKNDSEQLAARFEGLVLTQVVKVDHEGKMYGSVHLHDILNLVNQELGMSLEKKSISLKQGIKNVGVHIIPVKLKEDVSTTFTLKVMSEESYREFQEISAHPS